jgi:hypothetical protein
MAMLFAALALAPWLRPLAFHPLPGWHTGMSGNQRSRYVGPPAKRVATPLESSAWIARNLRFRNDATDPPNNTLKHLPRSGVIVWAVIYNPAQKGAKPVRFNLGGAEHFACCEAMGLVAGDYELTGYGPGRAYSVIVRIYFGSRPTSVLRAEARRALDQLELPLPR